MLAKHHSPHSYDVELFLLPESDEQVTVTYNNTFTIPTKCIGRILPGFSPSHQH